MFSNVSPYRTSFGTDLGYIAAEDLAAGGSTLPISAGVVAPLRQPVHGMLQFCTLSELGRPWQKSEKK